MSNNTNNIPYPSVILEDQGGGMSQPWYLYFTQQGLITGSGAPNSTSGSNGNFYFRKDPAGPLTYIYTKQNNVWAGIV
jgi:hypothetical protein